MKELKDLSLIEKIKDEGKEIKRESNSQYFTDSHFCEDVLVEFEGKFYQLQENSLGQVVGGLKLENRGEFSHDNFQRIEFKKINGGIKMTEEKMINYVQSHHQAHSLCELEDGSWGSLGKEDGKWHFRRYNKCHKTGDDAFYGYIFYDGDEIVEDTIINL